MLYARHDVVPFDGQGRRFIGIGGVILVHLLLIGFILSGLPRIMSVPRAAREMFLALMPKPEPQKRSLPRDTTIRRTIRAPEISPQIGSPIIAPTRTLSIQLFDCAPQNFGNLSPEDQARCAGAGIAPPDAATFELQSHVRDPARRAEELAARRAPARVSCTHAETQVIQNVLQQHSLIVDPLCAAGVLLRAARR